MKGLGILALLLGVGLMFYLMFGSGYGKGVSDANKQMKEDAQGFSGRDAEGTPVTETVTFEPAEKNGKVTGIRILTVVPGGAMEKKYGLRPADIVYGDTASPFDTVVSNADDCKTFLHTAYQYNRPLEVDRSGQKIRLPEQRNVGPAPVSATPAPQPPAVPAPTNQPNNPPANATEKTRDLLKKIESH
jgi:hypothetical protein